MYCVKCGKQTVGEETLCESCKAAENTVGLVKPDEQNKPNTVLLFFGKALASAIMGFGVFIISNVLNGVGTHINIVSMIFLTLIDIAVIVLSIIFGSQAIRTYCTFKPGSGKRPIPAFVLGIVGVILAAIATVIVLVFLLVELPEIGLAL